MPFRTFVAAVAATIILCTAPATHAAMPVIDVGAIAQLIMQIQTLRDQLQTARNQLTTARDQLTQARDQLRSMTGRRNMERLLANSARNYLPPDWLELERVTKGAASAYGKLATDVRSVVQANAVLTPQQVAALSTDEREQLEQARRTAAALQVMAREALETTSQRFSEIQQLINAIPTATDQKAILDLQTRVTAEQSMLQNEQTKLEILARSFEAEEKARHQRIREQAIVGIGSLRALPAIGL